MTATMPAAPAAPAVQASPTGTPAGEVPAVRLRGLPYTATEQDVLAFFSKHNVVDLIAESATAVRLLVKPSGKSLGQAVVEVVVQNGGNAAELAKGQGARSEETKKRSAAARK